MGCGINARLVRQIVKDSDTTSLLTAWSGLSCQLFQ